MNNETFVRKLFYLGALWNWGAVVFFICLILFFDNIIPYFIVVIPPDYLWIYLFLALVFVYGLGYYLVSRSPERNRDIVKMGIAGKLLVFLLLTYGWAKGIVTVLLLLTGTADLLFAILFIRAYNNYRDG